MLNNLLVAMFATLFLGGNALAQRLPNVLGELHTLPFGKLTQFWAHQAAGIPEGHAFIRDLEQQGFAFATARLGVLDTGFAIASMLAGVRLEAQLYEHLANSEASDNFADVFAKAFPNPLRDFLLQLYARRQPKARHLRHGSAVAYLMASNTAASVSLQGEIAMLLPKPRRPRRDEFKKFYEMIVASPSLPQVINYSMRFSFEDLTEDIAAAVELLATSAFFVTSAGNDASDAIAEIKRELAEPLIVVGSSDPTGHVSVFSQTGCAETIRACSDSYLQTINHKSGKFFNFGGTSGAAPMVSGALADTLSFLPDLSRKHAELLLEKTALPDAYGDDVGLLNYYKLLRVAHRLVAQGWSSTAGTEEALHDQALYDFSAEAEQLVQEAIATSAQDESFLKLRQAFFLDHDNRSARKLLAEVYRQHGYEAQAFYYDNPNPQARNAFIAQKDKEQHDVLDKFFAAIAVADTHTMLELLPNLNKKLFSKRIFDFFDSFRDLSDEQKTLVINFLQEYRIATVTIDEDGAISIKPIRDRG